MKKILILLAIFANVSIYAQTVRIAAAANLKYIFDEVKSKYIAKNPASKIEVVLGSSGALYQQITNGNTFDLFFAADKVFPDKLKQQNAIDGDVTIYALGKLVLWSNSIDVSKGINVILDKSVNKIAIAKPETAPYGERSVECLKYYQLYDKVKEKLVIADNIAQAAQFASTGNTEVGFIALALALAPDMKDKGKYFVLDTKSYKPVEQACVLLKESAKNAEAKKFMQFVLSKECKYIFEKYGFIVNQ